MINLVGNAVKYTMEGSVTVKVEINVAGPQKFSFGFSVQDTGIGIPSDVVSHLFQKFMQADSSITRKFGGTGLGLNISKQLVEMMGGEIGVESEEGKGSRFWFKVPFDEAQFIIPVDPKTKRRKVDRLPPENLKPVRALKVLVAEDHPFNRDYLRMLLPRMGVNNFEFAEDGDEAVKKFTANSYDMILMDCHMPKKSGYEVAHAIRNMERETNTHIAIIAITADAMVGTRERALESGMDTFFTKPIDPVELKEAMSGWVKFDGEPAEAPKPEKADNKSMPLFDLKLLRFVTDDNKDELRQLIVKFITQSEELVAILKNNCHGGENEAWVEAAHKFKAGAGTLSAKHLHMLCEAAQQMKNVSAEERDVMMKEIQTSFTALKDVLEKAEL